MKRVPHEMNGEDVITMVENYCRASDFKIPPTFHSDFRKSFPALRLSSLLGVQQVFCRRIRKILDEMSRTEPEKAKVYSDFHEQIAGPIKMQLLHALGFETFVGTQFQYGHFRLSAQEILIRFLEQRNPGPWQTGDLKIYFLEDVNVGELMRSRLAALVGSFDASLVQIILGSGQHGVENLRLLQDKPFQATQARKIEGGAMLRMHLKQFLVYLLSQNPPKKRWSANDLLAYSPVEGEIPAGRTLFDKLLKFSGAAELTPANVRATLEDDILLDRMPFIPAQMKDLETIRYWLELFLRTEVPTGGTWSVGTLTDCKHIDGDGPPGRTLHEAILRYCKAEGRERRITNGTIQMILQNDALNLEKPYTPEMKIGGPEDAQKFLCLFLEVWKGPWSPADLDGYGQIGVDGPTGHSLFDWILRHYDGFMTEDTVRQILNKKWDKYKNIAPFQRKAEVKGSETRKIQMVMALNRVFMNIDREFGVIANDAEFHMTVKIVAHQKKRQREETYSFKNMTLAEMKKYLTPLFVPDNESSIIVIQVCFLDPELMEYDFVKSINISALIKPNPLPNAIDTSHVSFGYSEDGKARRRAMAGA